MQSNHYQFVAFAHVVREGSFSAAAARLGVTQSAVTQHVAKLETQVGAQLLLRSRDGVELTRSGQEFFELADRLVAVDTALKERLQGYEAMAKGHMKIVANAPLPALRAISQFRRALPDVEIDFSIFSWSEATRMLRERRADVGLITDPPQFEDWEIIPLQTTRYVAYVLPNSTLANRDNINLADLGTETVILPENGSLTQRVVQAALTHHRVSFPRIMRITTFPLMCEAVLQGAGVAIFLSNSGLVARDLIEVPIAELNQTHETSILAPKDRVRLRLVNEFISIAARTGFE